MQDKSRAAVRNSPFSIHHSPFGVLALALAACAYLQPSISLKTEPHLVALNAAECRALLRDDATVDSLQQAAERGLDYVSKLPATPRQVFGRDVSAADLKAALDGVVAAAKKDNWPWEICDRLHLYRVDLADRLLVTGYYQPELAASRTRTARFRYPLYRTPNDLVDVDLAQFCPACNGQVPKGRVKDGTLVPYYSRAEIDAGALEGRGYELAWLDDPVEAFFLHVQGSALLRFDDGVHVQISYSSSNGRPYTSLGRVLVEQGKISRDDVSLQALKNYLRAHPEEQAALMGANQRYIFFRAVVAGPIGSAGVPLTDGRSIAADPSVYPPGGLVFLRVASRDGRPQPVVSRFALIQDAGVAITGPSRVDVFWGTGSTAEAIAGDMRNPGELYLVLP
jgi:peptidoglycan lytic transglycosylase A